MSSQAEARSAAATPYPFGTREAGLERLQTFVNGGLRSYGSARNADLGPGFRSNVSGLSPFIRHRLILEDEVLRAALAKLPLPASEKFVQEVFWRCYFKGWMEHHPTVWFAYRQAVLRLQSKLDLDDDLQRRYQAATRGETGIDCFDAWARELRANGYLHNHARMWLASIWIFTLQLPWELGADFFLQYLLDGDAAANTLGWRWVAGLHTRGKTYLARADNIRKYTGGRFDPDPASLATVATPVSEPGRPERATIDPGDALSGSERYGLLITDDDCMPQSLPLTQPPACAIGLSAAATRSPFGTGADVLRFADRAVEDALERFKIDTNCPVTAGDSADWGESLSSWASQNRLSVVVTAATAKGPAHDLLAAAEQRLRVDGITCLRLRRSFDMAVWPHATRGFFKLRKAIPALIEEQGLIPR